MLVAHGTTLSKAKKVETSKKFQIETYFLDTSLDYKLAIAGTACFALGTNPKINYFVNLYTKQDLIMRPFRKALKKQGMEHNLKKKDQSPGLIYLVEVPEEQLKQKTGLKKFFVPTEQISIKTISTDNVQKVLCLDEHLTQISNAINHEVEPIGEIKPDRILKRIYNTIKTRL